MTVLDREQARRVLHAYLAGAPTRVVLDDLENCIRDDDREEKAS